MNNFTGFSPRASLCVLGQWLQKQKVWKLMNQQVQIKQKVVVHTPVEKLTDAFINIVAGGAGVVEVNSRVQPDAGLQRVFGRPRCAEQSTVSSTLNACDEANVKQLRQVVQTLYRRLSQGYQHPYQSRYQLLDVDQSGLLAGKEAEGATRGFFSGQRGRRGRQLGRVLASHYDEIVHERLYAGTVQLQSSLQGLVEETEEVLDLHAAKRKRTIVRIAGGGGRDGDVNWLLARGYRVLAKVKNWQRTTKLAQSVEQWYNDPQVPGRQVGWVTAPHPYAQPTRQLVIRQPNLKAPQQWRYRALVFNLSDTTLCSLANASPSANPTAEERLLAAVRAYDGRGGGVETAFRHSKQGLRIDQRNKKRFPAQEMLLLLAQLAYNCLTWLANALTAQDDFWQSYGKLRLVRDVFHIAGCVRFSVHGHLHLILNIRHHLAGRFVRAVSAFWPDDDLSLSLDKI
jgi:hypothetical protein